MQNPKSKPKLQNMDFVFLLRWGWKNGLSTKKDTCQAGWLGQARPSRRAARSRPCRPTAYMHMIVFKRQDRLWTMWGITTASFMLRTPLLMQHADPACSYLCWLERVTLHMFWCIVVFAHVLMYLHMFWCLCTCSDASLNSSRHPHAHLRTP